MLTGAMFQMLGLATEVRLLGLGARQIGFCIFTACFLQSIEID